MYRVFTMLIGLTLTVFASCGGQQDSRGAKPAQKRPSRRAKAPATIRQDAQRSGSVYLDTARTGIQPARIEEVELPSQVDGLAIWGSTGRDDRGNLYFGVTRLDSALLLQYDPVEGRFTERGNVVSHLKAAGVYRDGEQQEKIHSKFVQADDGHLYFASMSEFGESEDGRVYPKWGGHLWRMNLQNYDWEHLLATKEALIAVGGYGRWIYALGYFDHAVYQFDTKTGQTRKHVVGSVGGHVSRNLLVDRRGHVYVPGIERRRSGGEETLHAFLVEFDTRLEEKRRTPLSHYHVTPDFRSFGLTGFTHLSDGRVIFSTSTGHLYEITPPAGGNPSDVRFRTTFHPDGPGAGASLFSLNGSRYLVGQASYNGTAQWVTYDLNTEKGQAIADIPGSDLLTKGLYGTHTRDDFGNCYLVGRGGTTDARRPIIIKVVMSKPR